MSMRPLWCVSVVFAVAVAACHPKPPATSPSKAPAPAAVPAPPPAPPPQPAAVARPTDAPVSEADLFNRKSLAELNAERPLKDAFFDYDQNTLREDMKVALQENMQWLEKWPQTVVRVEGYCDERGTAEYNLALGDRRAEVVKAYLSSLGVKADRIQTRTFGKESPFCHGSDESCWSQNRRGHFVITAK